MFDLEALSDALEAHGSIARVVLAQVKGSAPREAGTSMLIWTGGHAGTIGGGRLELEAIHAARDMLDNGPATATTRKALGPSLNQCCGGAVTLVTEVYDTARYRKMSDDFEFHGIWARPVEDGAGDLPASARRKIEKMQFADTPLPVTFTGGWLIEPVWRARQPVYIYGAGHVGRALALTLAPMPQFEVVLSDVRAHEFDGLPDTIGQDWTTLPTQVMTSAPKDATHFIMTPEHDYDLELCHTLLSQDFAYAGLIGSDTKWARFRTRLRHLGHSDDQIARIQCPIGDPALGKHPQAIAIGVAASLLRLRQQAHQGERKSA